MNVEQVRHEIWAGLHPDKKLSLDSVLAATHNFSEEQIIGYGDSGKVYQGHIDGQCVAIKRRNPQSRQGEKAFLAEILVLSRHAHHPDIVGFVGCFLDEHHTIGGIVYEHMTDGSLEEHINGSPQRPLPWGRLVSILISAANGVAHLHSHGVVHRDIKAQNILLDGHMGGKLSDFGKCKVPDQHHGYLGEPVYPHTHSSTKEQDVFEFGRVMLEVLNWEGAMNETGEYKPWAHRLIAQGEGGGHMEDRKWLLEAWDQISLPSINHVHHITFLCLNPDLGVRPTMFQVVEELKYAHQLHQTSLVH